MSRRYWIALAAIGLAICLYGPGQAQQEQGQPERAESATEANHQALSLPVRVVSTEAEQEARDRREEEAEHREIEDLRAQQGMDESTRVMKWAAIWQTIFVFVGTIAVVVTLVLMVQANRSAVAAVEVTREMGRAQTRAYLSITSADVYVRYFPQIILNIKNSGLSPSRWLEISCRIKTFKNGEDAAFTASDANTFRQRWNAAIHEEPVPIGPSPKMPEGFDDFNDLRNKLWDIYDTGFAIEGFLRWETMFGERFESEFYYYGIIDPNAGGGSGGEETPYKLRQPSIPLRSFELRDDEEQRPK